MNLYLLWLVGHIINVSKAQPLHLVFRPLRRVGRQIVHEETDRLPFVLGLEVLAELLELGDVDGLVEYLVVLDPFLLGDAT